MGPIVDHQALVGPRKTKTGNGEEGSDDLMPEGIEFGGDACTRLHIAWPSQRHQRMLTIQDRPAL